MVDAIAELVAISVGYTSFILLMTVTATRYLHHRDRHKHGNESKRDEREKTRPRRRRPGSQQQTPRRLRTVGVHRYSLACDIVKVSVRTDLGQ